MADAPTTYHLSDTLRLRYDPAEGHWVQERLSKPPGPDVWYHASARSRFGDALAGGLLPLFDEVREHYPQEVEHRSIVALGHAANRLLQQVAGDDEPPVAE